MIKVIIELANDEIKRENEIKNAISDFYLFIVLDILFVQYKDYIVMLIFGSDE